MSRLAIPRIETERLVLRGPCEADFEAFAAFGASDRSRWVGGPYARFRSWGGFLGTYGHWALRGYGMWMIEDKATGGIAGRVGIMLHDGWDEPELGWHVYDGFEGKGVAFEAARAARAYAAANQNIPRPISYIDPANTRSVTLAKRLGATFEREGTVRDIPCHIYRHPDPHTAQHEGPAT